MIGHFVNTFAIRTQLQGAITFSQLLYQIRDQIQSSYDHLSLPFQLLVQTLQPDRTLSYHPIYQVSFNLHNQPGRDIEAFSRAFSGLITTPLTLQNQTSKVALYLLMYENRDGLTGEFEYNVDLFNPATIERMSRHFVVLLNGIVLQPNQSIHHLTMLTQAEYHQIAHKWNDTTVDFGLPQTIQSLFEQQVARTPNAVALVVDDPRSAIDLTYTDLNVHANQLAHHLIALGVRADTLVGVAMERSVEMEVSLLAVLKAGGAYVPIDPDDSPERIRYMLQDGAAPIVLTQSHIRIASLIEGEASLGIQVDTIGIQLALQSIHNPQTHTRPNDLAYVIYTSGSTGHPKGVANQHDGVVNRLQWTQQYFLLSSEDRVLQKTPFSFDVSVWEFFWTLTSGATLVVARPQGHQDPAYLWDVIQRQQISVLHFVPSMLRQFIADASVRQYTSQW